MPEEEKQKKLDRLLSLLDSDNALNKKDFVDSFEKVIDLVVGIQKQQGEAINRLEETYKNLLLKMDSDHLERFNTLKGQVDDVFVGDQLKRMDSETKITVANMRQMIIKIIDEKIEEVDNKISEVKDGYTPIKGKDYFDGRHGTEITSEKILEKLKDKLNIDSIKDLRIVLNKMAGSRSGMSGMRKIPIPRIVDLSADANGSATTFNLPRDTRRVYAVWSSQFPVILRPTIDFTLSGNTLTIVSAQVGPIQSGQTLIAFTEALFYP